MYQVKTIDGRKINNGYEIQVIGQLCRVHDGQGVERFGGTYEQCVQWLRDRGLTH